MPKLPQFTVPSWIDEVFGLYRFVVCRFVLICRSVLCLVVLRAAYGGSSLLV